MSKGKNNSSATFELKGTVITRRMMHCSSVAFNLERYFAVPCGAVILVFLVPVQMANIIDHHRRNIQVRLIQVLDKEALAHNHLQRNMIILYSGAFCTFGSGLKL